MPKVSVIIPVYNVEKYLPACLDSVVNQTLQDIEIICINDGSTDSSLQLLLEYADRDNRIQVINFETNQGVSNARNAGIAAAKGEYIGFVDSDDRVELDFYEKLYAKSQTCADIIKGVLRRSFIDGLSNEYLNITAECWDNNHQIKECKGYFFYYFYTAIYKRTFLSEYQIQFPPQLKYGEDLCFASKAAILANKIEIVSDAFYYYTFNEASAIGSIAKNSDAYFNDNMQMTDIILNYTEQYCTDEEVYCAVISKLLVCVHFASGNLQVINSKMQVETQWTEYVLNRCRFWDRIYKLYSLDVAQMQENIKKSQLAFVRKKIEENRK